MRLALVIGAPHSTYRMGTTLRQGEEGLRANVEIDDFQAKWSSFETVTENPDFRGYAGNTHYIQYLLRDHPLVMRPGQNISLCFPTLQTLLLRTNNLQFTLNKEL